MNHERQAVVCDFRTTEKATDEEGLAFLVDGDVVTIIRMVDGKPIKKTPWSFNLRYEHGCMAMFSLES